jgi:hypothetical protein
MTDDFDVHERNRDPLMTCERMDTLLGDYIEGDLARATRVLVDRHLGECLRCAALIRDLDAIRQQAAKLPALAPSRELWAGIATRIEAPVIPLARHDAASRPVWRMRMAAAAAALVVTTAGLTYLLTMQRLAGGAGAAVVAVTDSAGASIPVPVAGVAGSPTTTGAPASLRGDAASAAVVLDLEITKLRAVLDVRRADLDPATIAVVENSLTTIDRAIADARAALARDAASAFLNEQLNRALEKKLGLLRTVAFLPPRA